MTKKFITLFLSCAIVASCGSSEVKFTKKDRASVASQNLSLGAEVGPICGRSDILGKTESSFRNGACGISNPVSIYAVGGVKLSQPAKVNCQTALALDNWVKTAARPSASRINKQLTGIKVAGSYACRNRNHKRNAKLSEHAKGNAIDISGFSFSDGSQLTVLNAYYKYESYFKTVRKQACRSFGTVLGPGVALHDDHFHFDTASYKSGPYCK